jgi:uncharacterized protein Smg (DUF494 family)
MAAETFDGFDRVIELTRRIYRHEEMHRVEQERRGIYLQQQKANDEAINAVLEKL